ncbi:hypothetical protein E4U43_002597 [Claviceps pusilla]|uniref:Chromatin assembly complex, subunit p90 n=1 Tax=Claviceps pusilla TaxID=123648 RepID=A0A9P7SY96_9HYPO|nr:hypothetical protein E4U43_002597 [Claviceps pusilla]
MPLFEMSPNVQDMDSAGRKRSHDEYAGDLVKVVDDVDAKTPKVNSIRPAGDSSLPSNIHSSPNGPGSPAITETGRSTPAPISLSPLTPTKAKPGQSLHGDESPATMSPNSVVPNSSSATNPGLTSKRKRLTAVEKQAKERELAEKKKEREEQAARKAAEKAKLEEEKATRAKEREDKRKQKEEEDRLKAEQRDEKKRRKEEEQRRIQEEKEKKARSQPKLNAFFKIPSTPKPEGNNIVVSDVASPTRDAQPVGKTEYEKLFKPFFVRENTRLAPCATQMDQETKDAKSRMLDEFIIRSQNNQEAACQSFDVIEHLCLPYKPATRGKIHHPVKHIMELASSGTGGTFDEARKKLASIPQKVIAFSQDVRPPYYGTVTLKPFALGRAIMNQLARRPMYRRLPLDYDYDSEAEWQEEEGEDVDMDDDDEEDLDDEDNMDGFLDDTEDGGLSTRRVFGQAMEPESTGICFENEDGLGPNRTTYEHGIEFITDGLEHHWGIDPFSTQYWDTLVKVKPTKSAVTAAIAAASATTAALTTSTVSGMPPPAAPPNAFAALNGEAGTGTAAKLVKAELMNDVKQAILDNKALSKVGIIDFIFHQFRDNVSRAEVKNTLELVAEKKGPGRTKEWDLKPGHELSL